MHKNKIYKKLKRILEYVEGEADKPVNSSSYNLRMWELGYKNAMATVRDFIWKILNEDD